MQIRKENEYVKGSFYVISCDSLFQELLSPIHNSTKFKPLKVDGVFITEIYHFYLRFYVKVT